VRLSGLRGRHFVQLYVPASRVAEQEAIARWFIDHHEGKPVVLLLVLDDAWCAPGPSLKGRPFPFWLYGGMWSYLQNVISPDGLEKAWRRLRLVLAMADRTPPDGYDNYELTKKWNAEQATRRVVAARPSDDPNVGKPVPAIDVLKGLVDRTGPHSSFVLLWPPVHDNALPEPGSPADARFEECKRAFATFARTAARVSIVDWRVRGPLALDSNNFWDLTHYRGPVARQMEDAVARAIVR